MRVEPLEGHSFGAIVYDLEPSQIDDPEIRRSLWQLWIDKGLVVFRGLNIDSETHIRLSRIFGDLEVHPVNTSHAGKYGELIDIRYRPDDGNIYEIDGKRIANWQPWHTDLIFTVGRNRGGILRALELPREGGKTGFIDQIESYAALPEALREKIEGLHVIYQLDLNGAKVRFGRKRAITRLRAASAVTRAMEKEWPRVSHPLVYTHPDNGRKMLNLSLWHSVGIKEMPGPDGDALLQEVAYFAGDESRAYDHDWHLGDLVLWDNWRMLHCSRGMPEKEARYLQRTTITGQYDLGQAESEAA